MDGVGCKDKVSRGVDDVETMDEMGDVVVMIDDYWWSGGLRREGRAL